MKCSSIFTKIAASLTSLSGKTPYATKKKDERDTEEIAEFADFQDLTVGYEHIYHKLNREGLRQGNEIKEFVPMDQPRACLYNETYKFNDETGEWEKKTALLNKISEKNPVEPPVELRGITLRQLRAVWSNIKRRCLTEKWRDHDGNLLTPEAVNLYDVNRYIIKPFTLKQRTSFVSALPSTYGSQPPRYYISHWWGEPVSDFIQCIEQVVRDFGPNTNKEDDRKGGGMTADTPIWVCAYANNQWALDEDIPNDPKESGFTKAMRVAEGRTITILDEKGIVFSRLWCSFELFLALVDGKEDNQQWGVYTAFKHVYKHKIFPGKDKYSGVEERHALGIVSGGATIDYALVHAQPNETAMREHSFPFDLISKAPTINIEVGEASQEKDRIHILNSIAGISKEKINDDPPIKHKKYDEVNNALRALFVSTVDRLKLASRSSHDVWTSFLHSLSKGEKLVNTMTFNFKDDGWSELTIERAIELVTHLPRIRTLRIRDANFGRIFLETLIMYIEESSNLEELSLVNIAVGGEEGQIIGERMASALSVSNNVKELLFFRTNLVGSNNLDQWGDALMKMASLKVLYLSGVEEAIGDKLKEKTKNRSPKLEIRVK